MDLCLFGDNLFGKLTLRSGNEKRMWGEWASESLEWFGSRGCKKLLDV
jgi:hypothetical protein